MLLNRRELHLIVAGEIDLVFRRQKRATVRTGGTLRTPAGVLAIVDVAEITEDQITDDDARRAGSVSRSDLIETIRRYEGRLFRIHVRFHGPDPRIALRESAMSRAEAADVRARLERLDRASRRGPWTMTTLRLIEERPAVRAPDLAQQFGQDTVWFKRNVRKLKELGLTESLGVGYRLSPRGRSYLEVVASETAVKGEPKRSR